MARHVDHAAMNVTYWLDDDWTRSVGMMILLWVVGMVLASWLLVEFGSVLLGLLG